MKKSRRAVGKNKAEREMIKNYVSVYGHKPTKAWLKFWNALKVGEYNTGMLAKCQNSQTDR